MKKPFAFGLLTGIPLGWLVLVPALVTFDYLRGALEGRNLNVLRGYPKVTLGMTEQDVAKLMGSAGTRRDEFHLGQQAGYEFEYEVARRIGAAYFVSWISGLDEVFTVAFDEQGRVIYKATGST